MEPALDEFRRDFVADITTRASADRNFMHAAFAERAGELLEDAEELHDFELCFYRGTGYRNRSLAVDGYSFDDADGSARILLAEFRGEPDAETLTQSQARQLFARVQAFVDDSLHGRVQRAAEESTPAYDFARELERRASEVTRLRFYLATDAVLSERVKDWPEGELGNIPAEFHIWDISRFFRSHLSRSGREELLIDFAQAYRGGLPSLRASIGTDNYSSFLCVIPGNVLADIYDTYGSRLLEGNVRAFLSTSVRVNKGIRNTILKEPGMFFAYNNGIAATASSAKVDGDESALRLVEARDFQIVNGGQTTASLANSRRKDSASLDGIFVQMKLTVIDEERSGTVIPLISRYANSQNKVSEADFFANHEYHRHIESISRRLRAPARSGSQVETFWFYERARGQYSVELGRKTPAERRRFEIANPKDQLITKTDLAKVENSWRQLPHEVSRGAQKNFLKFAEFVTAEWDHKPEQFSDEYFKSVIVHAIIFRSLEKIVPRQPWYDHGYRANIVAYSVAKLANLIETSCQDQALNVAQIWREQRISGALEAQLTRIAEAMFGVITTPETGIQNVTEWAKKEIAWKRAVEAAVPLHPGFRRELVDRSEERSRLREGRGGARIEAGLNAAKAVLDYGHENWAKLRVWAKQRRLINSVEERLLVVAANPAWVPTDRQSPAILSLRQRLEEEGYPEVR